MLSWFLNDFEFIDANEIDDFAGDNNFGETDSLISELYVLNKFTRF